MTAAMKRPACDSLSTSPASSDYMRPSLKCALDLQFFAQCLRVPMTCARPLRSVMLKGPILVFVLASGSAHLPTLNGMAAPSTAHLPPACALSIHWTQVPGESGLLRRPKRTER